MAASWPPPPTGLLHPAFPGRRCRNRSFLLTVGDGHQNCSSHGPGEGCLPLPSTPAPWGLRSTLVPRRLHPHPCGQGQPRLQQRDHTQAPGQGPGCSPSWAPSSPQPWASSFPLWGIKPTGVRAPRLRVGRVKGGGRARHIRAPVSAQGATLGRTAKRGRARGACSSDPGDSGRPEGQSPGRRGT